MPYITPEHRRAFGIVDKVADEIKLRFEFRPADIQFVFKPHGVPRSGQARRSRGTPGDAWWLTRG